jgi:hypothetical protein
VMSVATTITAIPAHSKMRATCSMVFTARPPGQPTS